MEVNPADDAILVVGEDHAAEFLGVTRSTLARWRRSGRVPALKVSGRVWYRPKVLRERLVKMHRLEGRIGAMHQ